jgi:hypothetical protein
MYLEMLELCVVDADERASDDLGESVGSGNEEKRIKDHFQFRIVWVGIGICLLFIAEAASSDMSHHILWTHPSMVTRPHIQRASIDSSPIVGMYQT